jgi:hypothetical protein
MKTQRELDRLNPFSDNGCTKAEYPDDPCSCKIHDLARYRVPNFLLKIRAEKGDSASGRELSTRKKEIKDLAVAKAKKEFLLKMEEIEQND